MSWKANRILPPPTQTKDQNCNPIVLLKKKKKRKTPNHKTQQPTDFLTSPELLICSPSPERTPPGNQNDVLSPTLASHSYKSSNLCKLLAGGRGRLAFCVLGIPETQTPWCQGALPSHIIPQFHSHSLFLIVSDLMLRSPGQEGASFRVRSVRMKGHLEFDSTLWCEPLRNLLSHLSCLV